MADQSQSFGRYLLLEQLAQGGMARVYRALLREESGFEKQVALKRMLPEHSGNPDFLTRFTNEARIASALNHSNIAQVFDFGQVNGEYFLAMELVDGPDLGTLLAACDAQGQPMPIPTAVFIAAEMYRGLGIAHTRTDERGDPSPIVHRDVSPQNVLISRRGEVKVVDFGIAKATDKAQKTRTGVLMGKCQYMAPEQVLGQPVDVRADVFSAGSVLFEMLAGRPLFSGGHPAETLEKIAKSPIPAIVSINPDVPPELEEILYCSLTREVEQRFGNGALAARELEILLHRMAPEFSREHLAALVRELVPPAVHPPGTTATVTRPADLYEQIPLSLAETVISPREHPQLQDNGPPAERAEGPAAQTRRLGRHGVWWAALLLGAALVGLLIGVVGRHLRGGADATPVRATHSIKPGAALSHDQWNLRLREVQRYHGDREDEARLMLIWHLDHPARQTFSGAGRFFWLDAANGAEEPPGFWTVEGRQLRLVFQSRSTPIRLLFRPPGSRPIRIEVNEP